MYCEAKVNIRARRLVQLVKCLLCELEDENSVPSTHKKLDVKAHTRHPVAGEAEARDSGARSPASLPNWWVPGLSETLSENSVDAPEKKRLSLNPSLHTCMYYHTYVHVHTYIHIRCG